MTKWIPQGKTGLLAYEAVIFHIFEYMYRVTAPSADLILLQTYLIQYTQINHIYKLNVRTFNNTKGASHIFMVQIITAIYFFLYIYLLLLLFCFK